MRHVLLLGALVLAFAGFAVGCGGGSDEGGGTTEPTTTETTTTEPGMTTDGGDTLALGQQVFADNCATCHGDQGQGGVGPNLQTSSFAEDADNVRTQVENGGGGMPAFSGTLSDEEIDAVAAYVSEEIASQG